MLSDVKNNDNSILSGGDPFLVIKRSVENEEQAQAAQPTQPPQPLTEEEKV